MRFQAYLKSGSDRITKEGSRKMKTFAKRLKADNSGSSAAEYALVLALVAGVIVTAFTALSDSVSGSVAQSAADIAGA